MSKVTWEDDEVSYSIFKAKYAKDDNETPEEFCKRAASICEDKEVRDAIFDYLCDGKFFFGGRTLFLAGRLDLNVAGSNCYVVPIEGDTIEDIYKANSKMARIFSKGGGVGTDISILRPKGSKVHNAAKTSSGAVSFLELFNATGDVISQHGRRGATMVTIDCSHPDIEELLDIKMRGDRLKSMNVSIKFDDDFMSAVERGANYELHYTVKAPYEGDGYTEYHTEEIKKTINARDFFKKFCECNWNWGDPGCIFVNRLNEYNLLSGYDDFKILTTNPCSELPLGAYGSCNLGSINLAKFAGYKDGKPTFDKEGFITCVKNAVRALNNALWYSYYNQPFDENRKYITNWAPIGLGVFGYADMLVKMRIKYGSDEAINLTNRIFRLFANTAVKESAMVAKEDYSFDKFDIGKTMKSPFFQMLDEDTRAAVMNYGLANGQILSVAPTGSISLLAGRYSGGCEPLFKLYYDRTTHKLEEEGKTFRVYSKSVEELLNEEGVPLDTDAEELKEMFPFLVESHDIEPISRVLVQATMQKYVDNSISSTVNLPESATVDDIFAIYDAAWQSGCKGITVFRDGCARGNILGLTKKEEKPTIMHDSLKPERRGDIDTLTGKTYTKKLDDGTKLYVTVNWKDGKLFEIFVNSEKHKDEVDGITRVVSLAMRCGVSIESIISQLYKLNYSSIGFAIGDVINNAYALDTHEPAVQEVEVTKTHEEMQCPECHSKDVKLEGHCWTCDNCGASGCAL